MKDYYQASVQIHEQLKGKIEVSNKVKVTKQITPKMKLAAAYAIAGSVAKPSIDQIIPSALDYSITGKVAEAVKQSCTIIESNVGFD